MLKKFNNFLINGDFPAPKKVPEVIQGEEEEQGKEKEAEPINNDANIEE